MKCIKCGANLENGALFCSECGCKVDTAAPPKRLCRECGCEIDSQSKFCSNCGSQVIDISAIETEVRSDSKEEAGTVTPSSKAAFNKQPMKTATEKDSVKWKPTHNKETAGDRIKAKIVSAWNEMDWFCRVATIGGLFIALLFLIAICSKNGFAIFISILQIAGVVVAVLLHKGKIKQPQDKSWIKYIVLVAAILLSVLNTKSYSWGKTTKSASAQTPSYQQKNLEKHSSETTEEPTISTTACPPYSAADCVGMDYTTVEADFITAGFMNVVTEKVEDLKGTDTENYGTVLSVSVGEEVEFANDCKFDKEEIVTIRYHGYEKCTVTMHVDVVSNLLFNKYDVEVKMDNISQGVLEHGEGKDFTFTVEPGTYTFAFEKEGSSDIDGTTNLNVRGDINLSLKISCHSDQVEVETIFVEDMGAVGENEAMIPTDCIDYKGKNYEIYAKALAEAGFSNIVMEPIYDTTSGEDGIGEIESVTINGESSFSRGSILAADAPVIIRHHANEADDPVKKAQAAAEAALDAVLPKEMARRAVIVAMTNCQATDVFTADGNSYDTSKFHAYSDIGDFFMTVETDGDWSVLDEETWHIDGIVLRIYDYDTYLKATCNVKMDGDNYVVFNVDCAIATEDYIDSDDPAKVNSEHFEPTEYTPYLTVPSALIAEDRDNAAARKKVTAKEERQSWIENQFHWWDGRHTELSELIKENLNDSDSFKHIDASFIDVYDEERKAIVNQTLKDAGFSERVEVGDLFVIQEFTAKNAFNATIKSAAYGIVRESTNTIILLGIV